MTRKILFISLGCLLLVSCHPKDRIHEIIDSQNFDESKVPPFTLPDPLLCEDGTHVTTDSLWWNKRRPELLKLFEDEMYGRTPGACPETLIYEIHKIKNDAVSGKAIMKEIDVYFTSAKDTNSMRILLFIPKNAKKRVPCFVSLNFWGNICVSPDTSISMTDRWICYHEFTDEVITNDKKIRGYKSYRWPLEMIIDSGYAVATVHYADLDPDFDDGFKNGVQPLFYKNGQTKPDSGEWGSVGAWAWGMSRIVDYLETDSIIDSKKTIAIGHSRLGKTALWAGAQDQRFAAVISNNSGCCGAALSKRIFGESVYIMNEIRPQWFCDNFVKYNNHEELLPVDQHELIALIAPRPVYVASATDDAPADPKGEFLSARYADTVYKFLKTDGLPVKEMPAPDHPVFGTIGYHVRTGGHDMTAYDWEQYIKFCNMHLMTIKK